MGRTENPTDRLEASRGHRHWAKEIGPNHPLFRVDHGVRPKNNLTEPALLEMSGNATHQDGCCGQLRLPDESTLPHSLSGPLVVSSLCPGQEKRTMREPGQIGNSGFIPTEAMDRKNSLSQRPNGHTRNQHR